MAIDLLLVNAPTEGIYGMVQKASTPQPPLGLAYVAGYAQKRGYTVKVLDCDTEKFTVDGFKTLLNQLQPKVVGFSSTTPVITTIIEMAALVKTWDDRIVIIAGGPHATALPEETLRRSRIDIVVRGEGEKTTVDILGSLTAGTSLKDVKGISFREKDNIISNPDRELLSDIDELPFPARHLLPTQKYRASYYLGSYGEKFANIIATRGCPYRCIFCGQDIIFKHTVRLRRPESIVEEIEGIRRKFGINLFCFEDSTFTANPELVREICEEISSRRLGIRWGAMGRANLADEKLYRIMKDSGCLLLCYGVESGNQRILERINKNITLDEVRKAVGLAKNVGIPINTSFILGLPGETKDTIMETIDFAIELDADYASFSLATPYPGTEFYAMAMKEGVDLSDWSRFRLARYLEPLYVPKGLTVSELKFYYRLAYKRFYMRPRYIMKSFAKIKSVADLIYKIQVGFSLFSWYRKV
jgi:radical SAM superfamily enzyme YgiQ (UPF0313 family)